MRRKKEYQEIQNLIEHTIELIKNKEVCENWTNTTLNILEWSDDNIKLLENEEFNLNYYGEIKRQFSNLIK